MSRRSALGQVRGLGSAKDGTGHWWSQRLTALALVPLSLWFMISLVAMAGADHATIVTWIASPIVAGLLILLVTATFFHAYLGLQVVIEDYVHMRGLEAGAAADLPGRDHRTRASGRAVDTHDFV